MSRAATPRTSNRRVTLEEVAAETGLGRTTISDILNRNVADKYSLETRQRVESAVQKLGYMPVRAAQQLARGRSGQLGLMLTRDFSNPFFARAADFVEREIRKLGYRLQIAITDGDPAVELDRIRQLQGDAVEGLIVGPVYEPLDIEQHRNVFRGGLPIVLFGGQFDCEFDQVTLDHKAGFRLGLEHLMARRHRRIGFIGAPPFRLRLDEPNPAFDGYRLFRERGVLRDEWFHWHADQGRFEDSHAASLRFVQQWKQADPADRPTAVLCHNDQVAMTAIAACHTHGVRVPEDLSLVGYDNLPESAYLTPALTTIDNRVDEQMRTTVARLLERVADPTAPRRVAVIEPTFVERASVRDL